MRTAMSTFLPTSRRAFVQLGVFALAGSRLRAADPWDKKAEERNEKDIERIMTKSPWAKKAPVDSGRGVAAFSGPATPKGDPLPSAGNTKGPQGGGGQMEDGPGPGGGGGTSQPEALVRWESALPILVAQKRQLPEAFKGHYAISITGFRLAGGAPPPGGGATGKQGGGFNPEAMRAAQQSALEKAKETTKLERKGKDPIHPSIISQNGLSLVLLFPHGTQPIELEDKEVTLTLQVGLPLLKTKFNLKEMAFQGKLEL